MFIQTDRQADRQTNRQTDRQTDRQANKQTEKERERENVCAKDLLHRSILSNFRKRKFRKLVYIFTIIMFICMPFVS